MHDNEHQPLLNEGVQQKKAGEDMTTRGSRASGLQGNYLWYCTIEDVPCTQSAEWALFLSFVSDEERTKIIRFLRDDDRKRALVSILLQKALIRYHLSANNDSGFCIRRTPENKPYMLLFPSAQPLGSWNYNLSHHGLFVGIASHAQSLVGADLVDILTRSPSIYSARAYIGMFESNLAPKELAFILSQRNEESVYIAFFIIWSLKESFIKAIGLGLGFELQNICFTVTMDAGHGAEGLSAAQSTLRGTATAVILNAARRDWSFQFFSLDSRHIMAIALGPITDSIESYRRHAFSDKAVAVVAAEAAAAGAEEEEGCDTSNQSSATPQSKDPGSSGCRSELKPVQRSVLSLLTESQLELFRKASCLPPHEVQSCPCCTPQPTPASTPNLTGRGVFLDFGSGVDDDVDVLVAGTPSLARTPLILPHMQKSTHAQTPSPALFQSDLENDDDDEEEEEEDEDVGVDLSKLSTHCSCSCCVVS